MAGGSSTKAMIRIGVPQCGHTSGRHSAVFVYPRRGNELGQVVQQLER